MARRVLRHTLSTTDGDADSDISSRPVESLWVERLGGEGRVRGASDYHWLRNSFIDQGGGPVNPL